MPDHATAIRPRPSRFRLDMQPEIQYEGWTLRRRWNGWATPMFARAVAECFMRRYQQAFEYRGRAWYHPARYNERDDTFEFCMEPSPVGAVPTWTEASIDRYQGRSIPGIGHVYSIGAFAWTWSEIAA